MPLLMPSTIDELARQKGFNLDSAMKGRAGRHLVRLTDLKTGEPVENPVRISGFTLSEAIRYLVQLPDRSHGNGAMVRSFATPATGSTIAT